MGKRKKPSTFGGYGAVKPLGAYNDPVTREENRLRNLARHEQRQSQTKSHGEKWSRKMKVLTALYGKACLACGRADLELTLDHVVPISKGGGKDLRNLQPLCGPCNGAKSDSSTDYRPPKWRKLVSWFEITGKPPRRF